jgi:hypothetical protein
MKTGIFALLAAARCSRVIEPIFWKVDNDLFSKNYTRHVQLQEKMDIFCPQYESPADEDTRTFSKSHHFQIIYMVDEQSFNSCSLNVARAKKIMSCEQPVRVKKFTMKFQEVNPNPYGLEFHADTDYYFISTSLGNDLGGISQMDQGVCQSHSMKLKLKVHRGDIEGVQRISEDYSDDSRGSPAKPVYDYRPYDEESIAVPEDNFPEDPSKEKQQELPNAIIVGVIVGTFLVILIVVAILLTRRVFENRKSSVSYPTLSDYQSSYVEKYDYPAYGHNNGSPQTVYTPSFSPNMATSPVVSLLPKYQPQGAPMGTEKRLTEDFSYIDGSRLSNRTHEIVMV